MRAILLENGTSCLPWNVGHAEIYPEQKVEILGIPWRKSITLPLWVLAVCSEWQKGVPKRHHKTHIKEWWEWDGGIFSPKRCHYNSNWTWENFCPSILWSIMPPRGLPVLWSIMDCYVFHSIMLAGEHRCKAERAAFFPSNANVPAVGFLQDGSTLWLLLRYIKDKF